MGVGTLVSSQEERALLVPVINRLSTGRCVPPSVYIGFRLFVLPKRRPGHCLRFAGGQEGGLSPGRIDPTASRPTQPRTPSPPRRASRPDPPVVCPDFGFDKFKYELDFSCFRRDVQDSVFDPLEGKRVGLSPGRIDPTASRPTPAPPRPAAPPCAAPTRPARGVSRFWIRQVIICRTKLPHSNKKRDDF